MRTSSTPTARGSADADQHSHHRPEHWRPDIEGLRAVAVGVVVAAHIGAPFALGGYVGVDVFFVISGFLITALLLREIDRHGRVDLARFYARRAVRLLPAAAVVLVATLVGAWLWLPRIRLPEIAADAAAAALNIVNLRLAAVGTDYLHADADPSPLQHFWSLAVEEQFYVVWPLLLLAVALLLGSRPRAVRNRVVAAMLVAVVGGSLALSVALSAVDPVWSYFGPHTRAWELGVGALIALAVVSPGVGSRVHSAGTALLGAGRWGRTRGPTAAAASWLGLALIAAAVVMYDNNTVFPGGAALLPVAGAAMVIVAGGVPHRGGAATLLRLTPFQYVGKISYGLYLWHWPVIMIGPAAFGVEPTLRNLSALMIVAFLLSVAMFHAIEHPVRTRKPLVRIPSRALAMGSGLVAATLAAAFVAVTQPIPTAGLGEADEITGDDATVWQLLSESTEVDYVPDNLAPPLDEARDDKPSMYDENCLVTQADSAIADHCWFGDPDGERTVVLFGDSHAAQWFPPVNQLAQASGWRLFVLTKAGCSVPVVEEINEILDREYDECTEWRERAFAEVEALRPDLVVASTSDDKMLTADDADAAWIDGWTASSERLGAAAGELYVIADTAWPRGHVPACLSANLDEATDCVGDLDEAILHPERREAAMAAVAEAGAAVIDPVPWMCDVDAGKCPVVVGNLLVYRDSNHMSTRFAAALAPQLAAVLPIRGVEPA
jgi:peptidoglycan/LPS O-acetylase OafA/YrhL